VINMDKSLEERLSKVHEGFSKSPDFLTSTEGGYLDDVAKFIDENLPELLESYINFFETIRWPEISSHAIVRDFNTVKSSDKKDEKEREIRKSIKFLNYLQKKVKQPLEKLYSNCPLFTDHFGSGIVESAVDINFRTTRHNKSKAMLKKSKARLEKSITTLEENLEVLTAIGKSVDEDKGHYYGINQLSGRLGMTVGYGSNSSSQYMLSIKENLPKIRELEKTARSKNISIMDDTLKPFFGGEFGCESKLVSAYFDVIKNALDTGFWTITRRISDNINDTFDDKGIQNKKEFASNLLKGFKRKIGFAYMQEAEIGKYLNNRLSKGIVHEKITDVLFKDESLKRLELMLSGLKHVAPYLDKISNRFDKDTNDNTVSLLKGNITHIMRYLGHNAEPFFKHLKPDFDKDVFLSVGEDCNDIWRMYFDKDMFLGKENCNNIWHTYNNGPFGLLFGPEAETDLKIENSEHVDEMIGLIGMLATYVSLDKESKKLNAEELKSASKTGISRAKEYVTEKTAAILSEKFGLSEDISKKILAFKNHRAMIEGIAAIQEKTGMTAANFYSLFGGEDIGIAGSKEERDKFHALEGLSTAYYNFNKTCPIIPMDISGEEASIEEANKMLYKQGLELLAEVQSGNVEFKIDAPEITSYVEKKKELTQRLKQLFSEGKKEEANGLIADKKKLEQELFDVKKSKIAKELEGYNIRAGVEPSIDELKECLSQLSQHNLEGKTQERAKFVSSNLIVTENSIDSNILKLSVWDKKFSDMPTYNEYHCCGFVGYGGRKGETYAYMANPAVQLLQIEVGSKKAMAITAATKDHSGKPVLLVDSVESGTHMFGRTDVVKAATTTIEEYARAAGFEKVLYSTSAGNNAPNEFLNNLRKLEYKRGSRKLNMMVEGPEVFLEAEVGNADGKVAGLRTIGYIKELK